ncbi:C-x8-C-x5-C-x3-H type zinc finger protein [Colletotrichum abscissum]|uniref:C-x8-C-x5-C-x3-H type zinc finger protein n=1 Tax=Colletotrichum abscissum TaxID=1671311 RepID=A0A9P9X0C7_9PEZI|nr:C-x8-C-x5-C-x3-H type zinc finger protein [Colletotrichum abscissum]
MPPVSFLFTTTERTFIEFGRGFGRVWRAQPVFSFIDVGTGKESADHKIREMLCIMLPVLEPYKLDDKVAPKFTLIETTPAEEGFKQVQRPTTTSTPLPLSTPTTAIPPSAIPSPGPSHVVSTSSSALLQSATAVPTRVTSPPSSGSQTPMSTKTTQPKYYLMNADGQRIDEPLPKVDSALEKGFNMRMASLGKKFCNNHHLHGKCNYPGCNYIHGNKLIASEMILLKKK